MECPQRHRATIHHLTQWRVTELYGRNGVDVGEDAVKKASSGLTNWKFRDAECAESTFVGARRPCKAFLGRRVRKSYARHFIAQASTS
jgi:hypothetical protein